MALQTFITVIEQPELLGLINQCLSAEAVEEGAAVGPANLHDTCKGLREATKKGLQPLRIATRSLQIHHQESNLQRELAAQLAAQILAGGAPGPGTP